MVCQADMWSVGCIFGELLNGKAMFPGTSTLNQLNKILEVTGKPNKEDILSIQSELAQNMIENINNFKQKNLKVLFPKATAIELDLLGRLLQFNPNKRINVLEALEHPYVADFHEQYAESEIECEKPIKLDISDKIKYTVKEYKQKLFDDLLKRKKEVRKKIMNMNMHLNYNSHSINNNKNNNINNNYKNNININNKNNININNKNNININNKNNINNNINCNNNQTQQQNLKVKKKKVINSTKYGK